MKKEYRKPIVEIEGFVPNEYVAVCTLVQLPGSDNWVEAIDVNATEMYINWKSTDETFPRPDTSVEYPVFAGSFKVKDSSEPGGYKNYDTSVSNHGDPTAPNYAGNEHVTVDYCCNKGNGILADGTGAWDDFHYHYNGVTNNHS